MKKLSETMQIGIAIVGLAIAYATVSSKKSEGGTGGGGGLDIPFIQDLSGLFSTSTIAPAESSFTVSQTILDAMFAASIAPEKKGSFGGQTFIVPQANVETPLGSSVAINPFVLNSGGTVSLGTIGNKEYVTGYGEIALDSNTVAVNPYILFGGSNSSEKKSPPPSPPPAAGRTYDQWGTIISG